MSFTNAQELLLDRIGVVNNAYVYFHIPTLIFEAPIAGFANREGGYIGVVYGTPTIGSTTDIRNEMLLCLGFSGIADGGTQRVRGLDTDNDLILFGRASTGHAEGLITPDVIGGTIRVYDTYHPFIKAPYISALPTPVQYKDEQLYPSDNAAQPPIANPGPDRIKITNAVSWTFSFDAANTDFPSVAVRNGATIDTYLWDMGDGSYDSGTAASSDPVVIFPRGARWVHLTVTDTNGISHTAHRLVVVADTSMCVPAKIVSMSHNYTGNALKLSVDKELLPDFFLPRSKVLVAEVENYSDTSIVGYQERFSGWLLTETVQGQNPRSGLERIEFEVEDSAAFLKRNYLFPQSINIALETGGWFEMPNANIDRLMHHILYWHTNIIDLVGFKWSGLGTTYPFPALTTSGGSIWENVNKLAKAFAHELAVDPLGQLVIVGDPHALPSPDQATDYTLPTQRSEDTLLTFTRDRYTTFNLAAENAPHSYWFMAKGIIATDDLNNAAVVGCVAPSNAPNFGGSDLQRADFLTISQDELNVWAANIFAAGDGSPIGELTLGILNPSMLMDLSKREYIEVELPDYILDRYDFDAIGNRWTVESIEYNYSKGRKQATYHLKKEIVAVRPAHVLQQIIEDDLVQAWSGFDESISPFTGDIIRGYDGMALTQPELEQTLSKTRLKVYLSELETDSSGNTDDGDTGTGTVGDSDFDALSQVNGAYLNISREMDDFFERAQDLYDGIASDPNVKTIFAQFVEASLLSVPTGAASAWIDYIVDTPDTTLPTFTVAERFIHTSDMYCAESIPSGTTEYITEEIDPGEWDRWFKAIACFSTEQYADWYDKGLSTPASLFSTYECYLYPAEELTMNATQIDATDVITGAVSMDWSARWRASPDTQRILVHVSISGKYETATHIKDGLYTVVKSTGVITASKLSMGINQVGSGTGVVAFTYPSLPAYKTSGAYSFVAYVTLNETPASAYANRTYRIRDTRTAITGGAGSFSVTFTDLGRA